MKVLGRATHPTRHAQRAGGIGRWLAYREGRGLDHGWFLVDDGGFRLNCRCGCRCRCFGVRGLHDGQLRRANRRGLVGSGGRWHGRRRGCGRIENALQSGHEWPGLRAQLFGSAHGFLEKAARGVHHALTVHAHLDGPDRERRFSDHGCNFDQTVHCRARATVGRAVHGTSVARMGGEEFLHLFASDSQAVKGLLILGLRLLACLEHGHLYATLHVDLAVAGGLDGAEQALREACGDEALHAIGNARRGHATERLHRQGHVRLVAKHVEDELAHLHVALAAAQAVVVVLVRDAGDFIHVGQVVAGESGQTREGLENQAQRDVRRHQRSPMQLHALGFGREAGLGLVLAT